MTLMLMVLVLVMVMVRFPASGTGPRALLKTENALASSQQLAARSALFGRALLGGHGRPWATLENMAVHGSGWWHKSDPWGQTDHFQVDGRTRAKWADSPSGPDSEPLRWQLPKEKPAVAIPAMSRHHTASCRMIGAELTGGWPWRSSRRDPFKTHAPAA